LTGEIACIAVIQAVSQVKGLQGVNYQHCVGELDIFGISKQCRYQIKNKKIKISKNEFSKLVQF